MRRYFVITTALFLFSILPSIVRADSITIGGQTIVNNGPLDLDPAPNRISFVPFFAIRGPWITNSGTVIFEQVPGGSATLTLTGTAGADGMFGTPDDVPFSITCGFVGCAGAPVAISFEWTVAPPIGPVALNSANLNGSVVSAAALAAGVNLNAFTGSGLFGAVGPFAGPGPFAGAVGPVPDPNPVNFLIGELTFVFGAQLPFDTVQLPSSAVVQTAVPEPASLILLGSGLAGILGYVRRRKRR